jgi:hypothetical protein
VQGTALVSSTLQVNSKIGINSLALGSLLFDAFTASAGTIATLQSNGAAADNILLNVITGNSVTGALTVIKGSSTTTGALDNLLQQNGNGSARFQSLVLGTGDAYSLYNINGGQAWSVGLDNSDSDNFKISGASVLGTSDYLTITTAGNVGIGATFPSYKLDVTASNAAGGLRVRNTTANIPTIALGVTDVANSDWNIQNRSGNLTFNGGTVGGLIGIGTTTPNAVFEVANGAIRTSFLPSGNAFLEMYSGGSAGYIELKNANPLITIVNGSERMRITAAGNLLVGTTTDQGYRVQITGSGDNMLNVWGATAPSIRLDNAASGATQRFVLGLATATNNFIQGASAGDVCITTATASPIVFGMWQTSTASEVMRITTGGNVGINCTGTNAKLEVVATTGEVFRADAASGALRIVANQTGVKLQGNLNLASLPTSASGLVAGDVWNNGGVLNIV